MSCDFDVPLTRLMASVVSAIITGNGLTVAKAEAYVRNCDAKRPVTRHNTQPTFQLPEVDCLRDETYRSADAIAKYRDTINQDAELGWATRQLKMATTSFDEESGATPAILQQLVSNEHGATTRRLHSSLPVQGTNAAVATVARSICD